MCSNLPRQFISEIEKEILGKSSEIEMVLIAFLAGGHVLLEDLPGMGKTSLAKIISKVFQLKFRRIQGSADLLPNDILGVNIFNAKTREFELREGPVFSEILLFDEMNRTPPRTQSALLQVMAEKSVTIDQSTYILDDPFFVLGTQNPSNSEGTYRLPDSQMDRFSLRLTLGYPDYCFEQRILTRQKLNPVTKSFSREQIKELQSLVEEVHVDGKIIKYILDLVHKTRSDRRLIHGISVRGSQELHRLCKARAVFHNRDYVIPEDVKVLSPFALSHRILSYQFENRIAQENYIYELLESISIPA